MKNPLIEIISTLAKVGNLGKAIFFYLLLGFAVIIYCIILVAPLALCVLMENYIWIFLYLPILGITLTVDWRGKL